jgi:Rieske Fe-S protein
MDRRNFIKTGCLACTSVSLLSFVVQACSSVKYTTAAMHENGLRVKLSEFETKAGSRPYVIVRNDMLQYPICVYKLDSSSFTALWMKCTHQGAELQVAGEQLVCPAHGSEYDRFGKVTQAPAMADLRAFPVEIQGDELFIDLRKKS